MQKQIDDHAEEQKVTATVNDVAEAVERLTGIPVSKMGASDIERLKEIGTRLKGKVIGQTKRSTQLHGQFGETGPALTKATVQSEASCSLDQQESERQNWLNN